MTDLPTETGLIEDQANIVSLGPVGRFTFPNLPGSDLYPGLASAGAMTRAASREALAWLDEETFDDERRAMLGLDIVGGQMSPLALALLASGSQILLDDGTEPAGSAARVDVGADDRTSAMPTAHEALRVLQDNGGVIVRAAHQSTAGLRDLHFDLVNAHRARVELMLVAGSAALSKIVRPGVESIVCIVAGEGSVRSQGFAPLPVTPGDVVAVPGPVRINGYANTLSLVIIIDRPQQFDRRTFLVRRAVCHPRLRLDLPANVDDLQNVYGSPEPMTYVQVMEEEIEALLVSSSEDDFDAWWSARLVSPTTATTNMSNLSRVRGRFPGGATIVSTHPDHALVAAGGWLLAVGHQAMATFTRFVAREVLDGGDPLERELFFVLSGLGLAEVVNVAERGADRAA